MKISIIDEAIDHDSISIKKLYIIKEELKEHIKKSDETELDFSSKELILYKNIIKKIGVEEIVKTFN